MNENPKKIRCKAEAERAMHKKLAESGLTPVDGHTLGYTAHTAEEVARLFPELPVHRAGFRIPYFDLKGLPITYRVGRIERPFYRFRYLEYGEESGFAAIAAANRKPLRYAQPPSSGTAPYFPHGLGADWQHVASDPTVPLVITEGELKAACATKLGYPAIGLCGVWGFRTREGQEDGRSILLPQITEWLQ